MSITNEFRVGLSTALMAPTSVASTRTCSTRTRPLSVSAASRKASTIADDCVHTRMVRRG
jgi:hypothetical protein